MSISSLAHKKLRDLLQLLPWICLWPVAVATAADGRGGSDGGVGGDGGDGDDGGAGGCAVAALGRRPVVAVAQVMKVASLAVWVL